MIRAVIVFDPSRAVSGDPNPSLSPEDAVADAKLLYYYSPDFVDPSDRRNQSNLLQGIVEFGSFIDSPADTAASYSKPFSVDTENSVIAIQQVEANVFLCIVVSNLALCDTHTILHHLYSYYKLLHGSIWDQKTLSGTMDDFLPNFFAAELGANQRLAPIAIRYAPIDAHALVAVHALGLELICEFESWILGFGFFFKGFLVSSSFVPDAFAPLFAYLVMNATTAAVSNTKLLRPPYGRIGTPAIAGGGSSAFGRCNYFDSDNYSHGFLFGPTGVGESVFCPQVELNDGTKGYLVAYIINGLMAVLVVRSNTQFGTFKRFENFLTDNHELNDEIIPLLRSDFAKAHNGGKEQFDFEYLNGVNKSLIPHDSHAATAGLKKSQSFFSGRFLHAFNDKGKRTDSVAGEDIEVSAAIERLADSNDEISQIAVKAASNKGWKVFVRRGQQRQIRFDFKDSKIPLWKVDVEIAHFLQVKFESIML